MSGFGTSFTSVIWAQERRVLLELYEERGGGKGGRKERGKIFERSIFLLIIKV